MSFGADFTRGAGGTASPGIGTRTPSFLASGPGAVTVVGRSVFGVAGSVPVGEQPVTSGARKTKNTRRIGETPGGFEWQDVPSSVAGVTDAGYGAAGLLIQYRPHRVVE